MNIGKAHQDPLIGKKSFAKLNESNSSNKS